MKSPKITQKYEYSFTVAGSSQEYPRFSSHLKYCCRVRAWFQYTILFSILLSSNMYQYIFFFSKYFSVHSLLAHACTSITLLNLSLTSFDLLPERGHWTLSSRQQLPKKKKKIQKDHHYFDSYFAINLPSRCPLSTFSMQMRSWISVTFIVSYNACLPWICRRVSRRIS